MTLEYLIPMLMFSLFILQKSNGNDRFSSSEIERLHFVKFETKYIEQCLDFLNTHLVGQERVKGKLIKVTGGGAFKYADLIQQKLGLE